MVQRSSCPIDGDLRQFRGSMDAKTADDVLTRFLLP